MWTRTRVTSLLGIEVPILQGPFGGGNSSVALAAAVSNAGGLGGFGAVGLEPEEITQTVREISGLTAKPFAINLWVPLPGRTQVSEEAFRRAVERLRPYLRELGLADPPLPDGHLPDYGAQVEALLAARPPIFSFIMGVPDAAIFREAQARGITTIGTATTVEEAVLLAEAGVGLVVASGSDAGGHRGSFLRPVESSLVGTMALVPQVAREVGIPVIAAGGIADGRGIAAALALGAEGVQIGTAFLASPESGAPELHKRLLGGPGARRTRLTRVLSGRLARGIENELMLALSEHPDDLLPYPVQSGLTGSLRTAAIAAGRTDLLAMWAGQNAASARHLHAAELLQTLVEETDQVLREPRLQPRPAAPA